MCQIAFSLDAPNNSTMLKTLLICLCIGVSWGAEKCCYDPEDVPEGCYTDDYPFDNMPLPDCPTEIQVSMRLYTRENPTEGSVITRSTIPQEYDPAHRTHFVVHGWLGGRHNNWLHDIKDLALDQGDYNMIIVGWSGSSRQLWYPQSASDTRVVGTEISLIARTLVDYFGATYESMYCSGHSLGSHVCGHAGQRVDGNWGRITGLDPAGPWFENKDHPDIGLDATDANLVDVMHTNGEPGIVLNLGTMKPLGHMDFYPNGGGTQPGCILDPFKLDHPVDMDDPKQMIDLMPACSHMRVLDLYKESIGSCNFFSTKTCSDAWNIPDSCTDAGSNIASMGFNADSFTENGLFYLTTETNDPYCPDY